MDWWNAVIAVAVLFLIVIGWARPFMNLKRATPQDVEELRHHLQNTGVKVSRLEVNKRPVRLGRGGGLMERCVGAIRVEQGNIERINVVGVATPFGDRLFTDYLVRISGWSGRPGSRKTRLVRHRAWARGGGVIGVEWRGDSWLSRELNYDPRLKDVLGQVEMEGSISILPDGECARVRLAYQLPSADLFQVIDITAGHIRSVW